MSGTALEPMGFGEEEICLLVTLGRDPDASLLREGERNLLGVSVIASFEDCRLERLKVGDFGDQGRVVDGGDDMISRL